MRIGPQGYKFEHIGHLADPPGDEMRGVTYKYVVFKLQSHLWEGMLKTLRSLGWW